ncbi:GNAT family N-acetyltransferase [Actinomadura formosensis]|uniref:GNAT family N-acetyltransferase n=1 Tax=Actinomadura formosensis TaxID=60706 RepID=UPI00082B84E5|nr:GNAT family N-acetyltransferase [Actinomadura formosensis]
MTEIVTYVEMTARDQLAPAAPVPGLALAPLEPDSPLIVELHAGVGTPYGWTSASRTQEEWATGFPARTVWMLSFEREPAGTISYRLHPGEVEIETFGLLPRFIGHGLGGYALTLGVRRAWELAPAVTRVWLHTSSLDHPRALSNYHRRGFRTFKTEKGDPT